MSESLETRLTRWRFNVFPAYWGTGGRITYIDRTWREVHVKLPLNWRTRNVVGVIFGGSIYAALDPIYMIMLMRLLGPEYIVWDKSATVQFKRPGRSALYARFRIEPEEIETIKAELTSQPSLERVYQINLTDARDQVHATIQKTIYFKLKNAERKV